MGVDVGFKFRVKNTNIYPIILIQTIIVASILFSIIPVLSSRSGDLQCEAKRLGKVGVPNPHSSVKWPAVMDHVCGCSQRLAEASAG